MIVVSDTSVLNAFFKIGHVALLPALYGSVLIPQRVYEEMQADVRLAQWLSQARPGWLQVKKVSGTETVHRLLEEMDAGEAEALVLALELRADQVLMDDHEGRKVAQRLGVPVVGTLGILLEAKSEGLISELRPLLEELIQKANFWVSESLQLKLLRQANEE